MQTLAELRSFLRDTVCRSLYSFCKLVLGYKDMTPSLHGLVCRYLESPRQHKLIVLPRGHLKTSVCTIGYALWRVCKNPNIRILIANATATNASHFLRNIESHIETNNVLRWLFPEIVPPRLSDVKWTETEMEVNRTQHWPEATVEAIGVGGTVVSRHYDLIIEDDLLAPEDGFVTNELVQKTIEWHKYATSLFVNPALGEQVVVGTRWLYDDFIAYLFQNEKWFLPALYKGVYEDGKPIWPERFTPEVIDRILEQQQPRIFSAQYMNDPVHEDARSFDPAWFRFYTTLPEVMRCVTAIDPAISQKKHGDYSAIVTVAQDRAYNRYVVDARRGRWGIDELIDNVFDVYRRWKPVRVGLETVMFQKALMWPFREAMRREDTIIPIVELRPSSRVTKEGRIQALHEYFANGSLYLNKAHEDLLAELRGWPAIAHDDLLDALAYAMQMLVRPPREEEELRWNPFSFESLRKELKLKQEVPGPWLWHGDRPAPVLGAVRVPQTPDEVLEWLRVTE
jgi:predicted phage terminase large subunit-like protein